MKLSQLALCLALAVLVTGSAFAADQNLLMNPDFSQIDSATGLPADYIYDVHSGDIEFAADGQTVRSGDYSVRIDGWSHGARARVWQRIEAPSFQAGATYKLSAWYQTEFIDDPAAVAVRVRFGGGEYALTEDMIVSAEGRSEVVADIHYYFYAVEPAEGDWKKIEAVFQAPANVTNMPVEFFLIGVDGTVWWDDVSLERID